jgi:hypothetical protein
VLQVLTQLAVTHGCGLWDGATNVPTAYVCIKTPGKELRLYKVELDKQHLADWQVLYLPRLRHFYEAQLAPALEKLVPPLEDVPLPGTAPTAAHAGSSTPPGGARGPNQPSAVQPGDTPGGTAPLAPQPDFTPTVKPAKPVTHKTKAGLVGTVVEMTDDGTAARVKWPGSKIICPSGLNALKVYPLKEGTQVVAPTAAGQPVLCVSGNYTYQVGVVEKLCGAKARVQWADGKVAQIEIDKLHTNSSSAARANGSCADEGTEVGTCLLDNTPVHVCVVAYTNCTPCRGRGRVTGAAPMQPSSSTSWRRSS